MGCNPK